MVKQFGQERHFLLVTPTFGTKLGFSRRFKTTLRQTNKSIFLNSCTSIRSTQSFLAVYDQASL